MSSTHPAIELDALDNVWFQVSGTICNIACKHCFNNSSPSNQAFGLMSFNQCRPYIDEAVKLGAKEFYFTGGEPFANKELLSILKYALRFGPATVLTNGMLIRESTAQALREISADSIYTLEFRVSLDGYNEEMNDAIRGGGVFKKTMSGVKLLFEQGFLPIVTVTRTWEELEEEKTLSAFIKTLTEYGYKRPRLKILPSIKIGQEALRTTGYEKHEYVSEEMMDGYDASQLICSNSRLVTSNGVCVCPILVNSPDAKLGETLEGSLRSFELNHQACFTCYLYGAICSNFYSGGHDV